MLSPDTNTEPVANYWTGIDFEIDEIGMGAGVIARKVADLQTAQAERQTIATKVAAEEIAKLCGQVQNLSAHLAGVLAKHAARESKVRT